MSAFLAALAVFDIVKLINDLFYFLVILLMHVKPTYGDLAFNVIYPYAHLVALVTRDESSRVATCSSCRIYDTLSRPCVLPLCTWMKNSLCSCSSCVDLLPVRTLYQSINQSINQPTND